MTATEKRMSLMGHLTELRYRLTRVAISIFLGFFVAYFFHVELFELLIAPVRQALAERGIYSLQAIHVTESILVYLKLSVVAGIIGTMPLVLYQMWSFISPGLTQDEQKYILPVVFFSTLFFALGVSFAYFVLLPFVTGFLTDLTISSGGVELQVTMQNVFSFSLLSMLIFGLIFQLPIVMFFLSLFGISNYKQFASFFRYFIIIAFVLAAMLTPPDPISQVLMGVPMIGLYGLGILISFIVGERKIDEDGVPEPVGGRLWSTVCICLLLLGGAIYGIVYMMMPGPTAVELLPNNTVYALGFNPEKISNLGITAPIVNLAFDDVPVAKAIADTLEKTNVNDAVLFADEKGHHALFLSGKPVDISLLSTILSEKDTVAGREVFKSPQNKDLVLASFSEELVVVGHREVIASVAGCVNDPSACLGANEDHLSRLDDLRASGPGWGYATAGGTQWHAYLPHKKEVEGAPYLSAILSTKDGVELLFEIPLDSEAAAAAYRTQINLWRERSKDVETEKHRNDTLTGEVRTLTSLVNDLTEASRASLEALSAHPIPDGIEKTAFEKKRWAAESKLQKIEHELKAFSTPPQEEVSQPPPAPTTLLDFFPENGLKDWTIEVKDNRVSFRLQLTVDGLHGFLEGKHIPK